MKYFSLVASTSLALSASIAMAQVNQINSDSLGLSSGTQNANYNEVTVEAGDLILVGLGTNKRITGNGATSFTLSQSAGAATFDPITTISAAKNDQASAAWLFYTTALTSGTATFNIAATGSQSTPTFFTQLRATNAAHTLAIETASFALAGTDAGASTTQDLDFSLAPSYIAGSSNYAFGAYGFDLAGSGTGNLNPTLSATIVGGDALTEANLSGSDDRGTLELTTSTAASSVTLRSTAAGNDLGSRTDYDFNGIGAYVYAVPEPSSFALFAGILGLTSVMLRRRAR